MAWGDVRFLGRFTAFRHLGFFPEQAANWAWLAERLGGRPPLKVLNLFGYTGVASLVARRRARPSPTWTPRRRPSAGRGRTRKLSGLADAADPLDLRGRPPLRRARGHGAARATTGIILDPPKYGRGPNGEVWRLFEDLPELLGLCVALLSDAAVS